DEVVEPVVAPKPVAGLAVREPDRPVVAAIGGGPAPAVGAGDRPGRGGGQWPGHPGSPPPEAPETEGAARGATVAFPLVGPDAAPPQSHRQGQWPGNQPSPCGKPWLPPHKKRRNRAVSHSAGVFYS